MQYLKIINQQNINESSIIYTGTGNSVFESFRQITKESPKKLYLDHLNILIIDENTAKDNISPILDYFSRDNEIRDQFYVLISKSKNILTNNKNSQSITSTKILESLKENKVVTIA